MIKLNINKNLVILIKIFFTNQKIQFVINKYKNKKIKIKTNIAQKSFILLIFFLIYSTRIFNLVLEVYPLITSFLFINDLESIILRFLVKNIA